MEERLPEPFKNRMRRLLGTEYQSFTQSFSGIRKNALRICELKTTENKFQEQAPFPVEPVVWVKNGFFYDRNDKVSAHPLYKAGVYYLTEASAMTPADRLPIREGDKVLDLCAAPGGKAVAAAGRLQGSGLLVANEISGARAKALLYNMESTGAENVIVTNASPEQLTEKFPAYFDKILVDAPCSGEGMFRKNLQAAQEWSEKKVLQLAALQKKILACAAAMLRPGGMLMYSTCTFSPEENEQNVSWFLDRFPEMTICPIRPFEGFDHGRSEWAGGDERVEPAVRIWPHRMEGEGHFLALFEKEGVETEQTAAQRQERPSSGRNAKRTDRSGGKWNKEEERLFAAFAEQIDREFPRDRLAVYGGKAVLLPTECPDTDGLNVLRKGLLLGEFKKERFEPSQSLALALRPGEFDRCVDLKDDPVRLEKYLKGETIDLPSGTDRTENGWILVCFDGFSLGFGKVSGGRVKNKLLWSRRAD